MVLQVKPTLTRFPTNSLCTPIDNTPLHIKCMPPVGQVVVVVMMMVVDSPNNL